MAFDLPIHKRPESDCRRYQPRSVPAAAVVAVMFFATVSDALPARADQRGILFAETKNFTVRSYCAGPKAEGIAERCESLRTEMQDRWLDESNPKDWQPRCQIVLYATKRAYVCAVGRNAGQTSGSSLIRQDKNRIVLRRIDLLVDPSGKATALPHELTHVVLADAFRGQQAPPWLDEGIATLADSEEKVGRHRRDCHEAIRSGTAFHVFDLLSLNRLTSSVQFPAFYGQSVTLVEYLCQRDDPTKLVPFAKLAMERGYDEALQTTYEIRSIGHLQQLWLESLATSPRHRPNYRFVSSHTER